MWVCAMQVSALQNIRVASLKATIYLEKHVCDASRMLDLGSSSMVVDGVGSLVAEYRALGNSRFGTGFGRSFPGIILFGLKTVRYSRWLELPT